MKVEFDRYTFKARLQPALLASLPVALSVLSLFPNDLTSLGMIWSLIVWSGGTVLITQMSRDAGKSKEQVLFKQWGGKPSIRLLRHRDATNKILLQERHRKLKALMPAMTLPNAKEEDSEPERADEIYERCVVFLLETTRDKKQFDLLFEENCNYGFRRNLWGLKSVGITIAVLGVISILALLLFEGVTPLAVASLLIDGLLLLTWIYLITPRWVRAPAEIYAERLMAACEKL